MTLSDVATAGRFVDLAGLLESCEVDGFRADFLSWGHYQPEYWRNYWHSHSFHEVCLAYSGEGRFNSGSTQYDVQPGAVFIARPGDVHGPSARALTNPDGGPDSPGRTGR